MASSWRCEQSLNEYLIASKIIGIAGIDTRRLTRVIRDKGAQRGCLIAKKGVSEATMIARAQAFPSLKGVDLALKVTTMSPFEWSEGEWCLESDNYKPLVEFTWHVVVYDFGVKRNMLRMLAQRGCKLTIVPADTSAKDVLALKPDGIFLSNGPGDPNPCVYAIDAITALLNVNLPIFGICLGHQLLALASGAKTQKMNFGHHGSNHPVQNVDTKKVMITSQNHGFTVSESTLPDCLRVTHKSLFDGSLQGIERVDKPAFSFQGHPEASPGPHDADVLFDRFIELLGCYAKGSGVIGENILSK